MTLESVHPLSNWGSTPLGSRDHTQFMPRLQSTRPSSSVTTIAQNKTCIVINAQSTRDLFALYKYARKKSSEDGDKGHAFEREIWFVSRKCRHVGRVSGRELSPNRKIWHIVMFMLYHPCSALLTSMPTLSMVSAVRVCVSWLSANGEFSLAATESFDKSATTAGKVRLWGFQDSLNCMQSCHCCETSSYEMSRNGCSPAIYKEKLLFQYFVFFLPKGITGYVSSTRLGSHLETLCPINVHCSWLILVLQTIYYSKWSFQNQCLAFNPLWLSTIHQSVWSSERQMKSSQRSSKLIVMVSKCWASSLVASTIVERSPLMSGLSFSSFVTKRVSISLSPLDWPPLNSAYTIIKKHFSREFELCVDFLKTNMPMASRPGWNVEPNPNVIRCKGRDKVLYSSKALYRSEEKSQWSLHLALQPRVADHELHHACQATYIG